MKQVVWILRSKKKFCENSKLVYPRYLGYFYYHGTMIFPCIRQQETIRNCVTFCARITLSWFFSWLCFTSLVMLSSKDAENNINSRKLLELVSLSSYGTLSILLNEMAWKNCKKLKVQQTQT